MKDVILNAVVFAVLAALFGLAGNDWKLPGSEPPPAAGKELCEHGVPEADCATCRAEGERGGAHAATTYPACIIGRLFDADDRG